MYDIMKMEDGTDRLFRNLGKKFAILCCLKSLNSADLIEPLRVSSHDFENPEGLRAREQCDVILLVMRV
jgi:hypothetical protein